MIKEGDYLICKKTYFIQDETIREKIMNRLCFSYPIFKFGKKYKIENILINDDCPYVLKYNFIKIKFDIDFIQKYFYTKVEERKLKLKKLKI